MIMLSSPLMLRRQALAPLLAAMTGLACSSVYEPKYADSVEETCGPSPIGANAVGYHHEQDDWNQCAESADRRSEALVAEQTAARTKAAMRTPKLDTSTNGRQPTASPHAPSSNINQANSESQPIPAPTMEGSAVASEPTQIEKASPEQEAAYAAERARLAHSLRPIVGSFGFMKAGYQTDEDCELWGAERLNLTVAEDGSAEWSAFRNGDAICAESRGVASNCGAAGVGYVEETDGQFRLVTTRRGAYGGGGTPPTVSVWQCGQLRVRAPYDWSPAKRGQCVRLGSEPDDTLERASEALCAAAPPFEELDERGVVFTSNNGTLVLRLGKREVKLKRLQATDN